MSIHQQAPLFEALKNYVTEGTIPFHVPGHKQGRSGDAEFLAFLGQNTLNIDLTCMEDLDNISGPKSAILEAEKLAALAYGADHAFFLCNGTSSGIQAMLIAACKPGDKVLIPRNAHKSVIGGIILSGAEPVYLQPEINDYLGITMGITPEAVQAAIDNHPDLSALFIINPTYYGVASDLVTIVDICHQNGIMVLVDEAHGGHFYFDDSLPPSAMAAGADLAAVSTHKLTGSLTQSSLLLMKENDYLKPSRLKSVLNLTQTTSPSYILLASLDASRRAMALHGREMTAKAISFSKQAREELQDIPGFYIFGDDLVGKPGCFGIDPTKVAICARGLGISGYEFERILRQEKHIQVELSDFYNVLFLYGIGDDETTMGAMVDACKFIAGSYNQRTLHNVEGGIPPIPELVVSPRFAYYSETVSIPLEEAEGEISAEMVMAYPPGIPVICPGEMISWEIIRYVHSMREANLNLQGTEDPEVAHIRVLRRNLSRVYARADKFKIS